LAKTSVATLVHRKYLDDVFVAGSSISGVSWILEGLLKTVFVESEHVEKLGFRNRVRLSKTETNIDGLVPVKIDEQRQPVTTIRIRPCIDRRISATASESYRLRLNKLNIFVVRS
jgi:predicted methyltransferase MtxX (methanogen marker protein 4)